MQTKILTTSNEDIKTAAEIIKSGGLVAFPTETVYGLGANALDAAAVKKVYAAKGRPSDNPMIVHIASVSDLDRLASERSAVAMSLMDHFWPGSLTLVLNKGQEVPDIVTGGSDTVAVRMPDDAVALALITAADRPIAAPSANLSGKPSPTKPSHVMDDLSGKIDAIIAGNDCRVGIESTVLDVTGETLVILRPGIVTKEDIEAVSGVHVEFDPALLKEEPQNDKTEDFKPKSPGMKYKHYAPKARMMVIEGHRDNVKSEIERARKQSEITGDRVGVILFEEKAFAEAAHDFFAKLRELDEQGVDLILAGALSDTDGVGFAVMNRMLKSSGYNIVRV
ncbi:MAG: L-threonylcarbamoyladenylate synthase [Clostridiales bacterium]|nr:L-threonylcarbamoyladenylate synthase [Clostridiales bacterium]